MDTTKEPIGYLRPSGIASLKDEGGARLYSFVDWQASIPVYGTPVLPYQARVEEAHHALFHDDPTDVAERLARFMEEANETCQAFGMTRDEAHQLVEYTYSRPAGEPAKEIGAAMLTLTSLCVVAGHDLATCAEADLEKLQRPETIARIRAKRSTRHGRGPLPGFDPSSPGKDGAQEVEEERIEPMSLVVALDFADNPRPYHTLQAPADTNGELYEALRVITEAYRGQSETSALVEAARDALAERERQKGSEGWTPEHDDTHTNGEMAHAAAAYAIGLPGLSGSVQFGKTFRPWHAMLWPWDLKWWKPKDRRRDLVRAAALIIAEIARLDRAPTKPENGQGGAHV